MADERGPECSKECAQLSVLGSRMAEVERKLNIVFPMLADIQVNVEPMKEIVSNYKVWKSKVSDGLDDIKDFITRQDQQAIDLAKHLKGRKEEDDLRRERFRWVAGIAVVVIIGLLGFLGSRAWDQITILNRLENDWLRYQPSESSPKAPLTDKTPKHSFWHPSTPITMEKPPQNATTDHAHY